MELFLFSKVTEKQAGRLGYDCATFLCQFSLFLLDQTLISCEFTDESSGDETSPEKNGSFEREDKDSKKERKRLKREEKEKRKQERRKKKLLKSHGVEGKISVPPGKILLIHFIFYIILTLSYLL